MYDCKKNLLLSSNVSITIFGKVLMRSEIGLKFIASFFCSLGNTIITSQKAYGRHHDLVDRYGISVSQMTTDMFLLS
jgi:hypothetical protein